MKLKNFFLIIAIFLMLLFVGCSNDYDLKSITISGPTQINVGEEIVYTAIFDPIDYKNQNIIWGSSDEEILSSLGDGKFIANEKTDNILIYATSEVDNNIKASFEVSIIDNNIDDSIDLGGYTIKMGYNKYFESYVNKIYSLIYDDYRDDLKNVIEEIENNYNCEIEFKPMGDGDSQTSIGDIETQLINKVKDDIKNNNYDIDFAMIPYKYYLDFIKEDLVIKVSEFNDYNELKLTTGSKLLDNYKVNPVTNYQTNYLIYNTELLNSLELNETPIDLFKQGKWTYSKFLEYLKDIQNALEEKYGFIDTETSLDQEYYAVGGLTNYLWNGLQSTSGELIIDYINNQINMNADSKKQAADVVKELYKNSLIDTRNTPIHLNYLWNDNKILFASASIGELNTLYYDSTKGNAPKFTYVPWPSIEETTFDNYNYCISDIEYSWFMIKNREDDYKQYSNDCTSKNIYIVISELFELIQEKQKTRYIPSYIFDNKEFIENEFKPNIMKLSNDPILSDNHYDVVDYVDELNQYIKEDVLWDEAMCNYIQELQSILDEEKPLY